MARLSRPEEAARALLQKYQVSGPVTPISDIAAGEGAEVVYSKAEGNESGFALRDNGRLIVGVNAAQRPARQRFTIAHELGHLTLHPGKPLIVDPSIRINRRNEVSSLGTDFEEIQANAFAAELLMPRGSVLREAATASDRQLTYDKTITLLASRFDVSKEAMTFRLINLGIVSA